MNEEINVKKQLKISIPIAFENLINILMTLVDTLVISISIILLILVIHPIFPLLFKVDKIANTYLIIRLLGFIQSSLVTVLSGHQRTIGNQKSILKLRIFAVILNLILDIVVVKIGYGIVGVALVTVLIDTILAIYLSIFSRTNIRIKFVKSYFKDILHLFKWNFV